MSDRVPVRLVERMASETSTLALLCSVLDDLPIGVALLVPVNDGRDFEYLYSNRLHHALKPGAVAVGKTYGQVWPELAEFALPRFREIYDTGVSWKAKDTPLEVEMKPGELETRNYTFQVSRIVVDNTPVLVDQSIETTADIQALRALRESEERFRSVLENSLDAAYRRDLRLDAYDYLSPVIESITGFTAEEFAALSVEEVLERIHPDDLQEIQESLNRAKESGRLVVEYRFRAKDGRHVWLSDNAVLVRDAEGAPRFRSGTVRDISNRKQFEEQARREKQRVEEELVRSNILQEVAAASLKLDSHALAEQVLDTLQSAIGLRAGVLYVLEEESRVLTQLAVCGYPEEARPLFVRVPLDDQSISGQSALADATLVRTFEELPPATRERAIAAGEEDSLWVVLPVRAIDRVTGNLTLVFESDRTVGDEDLALFRAVADQLGVAIMNAQLYERERESARVGEALAHIDHDTHSSLRVEDVVIGALAEGAKAIGAESAAIDGIEDDRWVVWYDWGFQPSIVGDVYTHEQNPHGVEAARTGKAIAIEDAYTDPRVDNETMKAYGLRSAVVAPLIVRGEPIAALYYNYHSVIHHFTKREIDFVAQVASSLSLAIENARLYQTEREVSDRLQEALLSLPDEIEGVQFAHAYHSAAEVARVGGDFYDIFEMGRGLIGITVGDIAGKGLEAAALTSLVKNTIRAHATEKGAAPARILELTNDVVFNSTHEETFATVFFAVLDCEHGRLHYANGGHTTGALIDAGGTVVPLGATGPVVGAFRGMQFDVAELHLDLGELLFLYTDGLTEARRGDELFGEERLFRLLARARDGSPPKAVREVVKDVLGYAGGLLNDDLAVLAVKRNGPGSSTSRSEQVEV